MFFNILFLSCEFVLEFRLRSAVDLVHIVSLIARFMGPTWGPTGTGHDPGGPHVGPMNFAIWSVVHGITRTRSCNHVTIHITRCIWRTVDIYSSWLWTITWTKYLCRICRACPINDYRSRYVCTTLFVLHSYAYFTTHASSKFLRGIMTSSNGNIFRVTRPLCGKFTLDRWILLTKASDAELWCFLFMICAWIHSWVNNREAGNLRRHRNHYEVTVISIHYTAVVFRRVIHGRSADRKFNSLTPWGRNKIPAI